MKLNRLFALLLALMMVFATVAMAEDVATTPSNDDVIVTVNGDVVTYGEIVDIASNLASTYSQYGYDINDSSLISYLSDMALDFAVQYKLMDQQAALRGYDQFTEEELAALEADAAAQWASIVDTYVNYYGGLTAESTEDDVIAARTQMIAMLETSGYTEAMLLQTLKENAAYERLEADMVAGATVTDADVLAAYEDHVAQDEAAYKDDVATYEYMTQYYGETSYYIPEGYRGITHILLEVDATMLSDYETLLATFEEEQGAIEAGEEVTPTVTQEQIDAAQAALIESVKETTDEIYAQLAEGAAFADLIYAYGTDPGMLDPTNAAEGYPVHMDSIAWDPAFVKAAYSINEVGEWSEPFLGSYGVHIVYYLRDVPSGAVELTDALKADLHATLLSDKENALFNEQMQIWFDEAEIVYTEAPAAEAAE